MYLKRKLKYNNFQNACHIVNEVQGILFLLEYLLRNANFPNLAVIELYRKQNNSTFNINPNSNMSLKYYLLIEESGL